MQEYSTLQNRNVAKYEVIEYYRYCHIENTLQCQCQRSLKEIILKNRKYD